MVRSGEGAYSHGAVGEACGAASLASAACRLERPRPFPSSAAVVVRFPFRAALLFVLATVRLAMGVCLLRCACVTLILLRADRLRDEHLHRPPLDILAHLDPPTDDHRLSLELLR